MRKQCLDSYHIFYQPAGDGAGRAARCLKPIFTSLSSAISTGRRSTLPELLLRSPTLPGNPVYLTSLTPTLLSSCSRSIRREGFEVVDRYQPDLIYFDNRLVIIPGTRPLDMLSTSTTPAAAPGARWS